MINSITALDLSWMSPHLQLAGSPYNKKNASHNKMVPEVQSTAIKQFRLDFAFNKFVATVWGRPFTVSS